MKAAEQRAEDQHQKEILQNRESWNRKPHLRQAYQRFYQKISAEIDHSIPGRVVEIGSGNGNLKSVVPGGLLTDLFPNPWLDLVCDAYRLPFTPGSISNLILFDVFHHIERPNALLTEASRVLAPGGRLILFEPYISLLGRMVYGLGHHEPIGLSRPIAEDPTPPDSPRYYAAQGNATRLFFRASTPTWMGGWKITHREVFSAFRYLLTGGYRGPVFCSAARIDKATVVETFLDKFPRLAGTRCLIVLQR